MNNEVVGHQNGFSLAQVILICIAVVILTASIVVWLFITDIFRSSFEPVELNAEEQVVLDNKLQKIGISSDQADQITSDSNMSNTPPGSLTPEAYSEDDASREVRFSEREVNALLANNTDLADKLAIDLSGDLISAKLLIPLDPDFPVVGGKTLKVTAGIEFLFKETRPVLILKGISVWGIPVPAAYLGELKNTDIIEQYGDQGFWKSFSDGLENVRIDDGEIYLKFKP